MAPIARVVAMTLAVSGAIADAHAQQAFSGAWFAAKGAMRNTVEQTGKLPNGQPVSTLTNPSAQQRQANAQLQRSINNLGVAAQSIAAQQVAQAAARKAALNDPSLPDGLAEGGLKVDTNSLTAGWLNASAPTQTVADGRTTVGIQQTADKAILNWETFNVGKNTTVAFHQQQDWAVLNRVNDPSARPSRILGQIKGDGTVMIVNRNGIVFSGSSQIDTRNLLVAAANITDSQFKSSGIYGPDAATPTFTEALGKVEVKAGAQITTKEPTSATQGGGYVLLVGGEVANAGEIITRKGQIQLAAGDSFIIRKGAGTEGNTASTTKGNEVAPQLNIVSTAGKVSNTGLILAREGDITLAGRDVQQNGVAVATTTVNTRGTVHLLNSASDTLGKVTLGQHAVTAIVPEDDGKTTALDSQRDALIKDSAAQDLLRSTSSTGAFDNLSLLSDRRDQSRIEVTSGGNVVFDGDSLTLATGGQIAVSAMKRSFVADRAQLDVSGAVGVNLAMESNNVKVNVQGNEQRDAPVNREGGKLLNANVWIDRRRLVYVPAGTGGYESDRWYTAGGLLEVGGYLSNQGHRIDEWLAQGGTIVLGGSEVVTQAGSAINLSGGSVNVQTGYLNQTWLKGNDGRLYNVNSAPADIAYTGVYRGFEDEHKRWGTSTTGYYYNPLIGPQRLLENGYTVGRDAGRLIIGAPTAVIEGDIVADVFNGAQQAQARAASITDGYKQAQAAVALPGALLLGQYGATDQYAGRVGVFESDVRIGDIASITADLAAGDVLASDRIGTVWLDASRLNAQHLGGLDLATARKVVVEAPLVLADGGRLSLTAPVVGFNADVTARGGTVSVNNSFRVDNAPGNAPNLGGRTLLLDGAAAITVDQGVTLDLRGLWVNTALNPETASGLAYLNGGLVTLASTKDVSMAAGSLIDVSSGGAVLPKLATKGGKGGSVALSADAQGGGTGVLTLDGDVRGFGVNGGGTLALSTSGVIVIGDASYQIGSTLSAGSVAPADVRLAKELLISAGMPLPVAYSRIFTSVSTGVPLPSTVSLPSAGLTLAADWVVPDGAVNIGYNYNGQYKLANPGVTIPQSAFLFGANYWNIRTLPAGYVLPPAVFSSGFSLNTPISVTYVAGTPAPVDVTVAAGTILRSGTFLARGAQIEEIPTLHLPNDAFSNGFSKYTLNGERGLIVADGTAVAAIMPVMRFTKVGLQLASGADPLGGLERYLAPVYTEDALESRLTQRRGADLELRSGPIVDPATSLLTGGSVMIGEGAHIAVDPGRSVRIASGGQVTIEGAIEAPGGNITIVNERTFTSADPAALSVWIGSHAVLDAAARAYTAMDVGGRTYGVVPNGGSIVLGSEGALNAATKSSNSADAFVVVRPGAMLDASGAQARFFSYPVNAIGQRSVDTAARSIASDGGAITLRSYNGIYNEGSLRATSGGAGASGGSLSIELESPIYHYKNSPDEVAANLKVGRVMTISQDAVPYVLSEVLKPGQRDVSLTVGRAGVSAAQIATGGFDDVSLLGGNAVVFDGEVRLSVGRSLALRKGSLYNSESGGHAELSAPYVLLDGQTSNNELGLRPTTLPTFPTDGALSINASLIDVRNRVNAMFADTRLASQSDLRFLTTTDVGGSIGVPATILAAIGNLDLVAGQVYPASGSLVKVYAGFTVDQNGVPTFNRDATLSIARPEGVAVSPKPYSVFGDISLSASEIRQGGTLIAPLGAIDLYASRSSGSSLQTAGRLEMLPGSLTSVSAAGLVIPFGGTVDGVAYTVNGGAPATANLLTGQLGVREDASVQGISLRGINIASDRGAVVDLSGGGTLAGAAFTVGRGGSVDTLLNSLATGGKVYAILPGVVTAPVAGGYNTAWAGAVPGIGQQITLPAGVPGLPAGTYTLLPANYALLPGAYRVELGARTLPQPKTGATAMANGSFAAMGTQGVANTSIRDALDTRVTVTPGATVRTYSKYNEQSYDAFQLAQVATFGTARPLLARDGKFLSLTFSNMAPKATPGGSPALVWDGMADFLPADGGYGGTLSLRPAKADLAITAPHSQTQRSATLVPIDADVINRIGAPNLYIGGRPTLDTVLAGTIQLAGRLYTTGSLTLEKDAVLSAAQAFLAANKGIELQSGARIDTRGWDVPVADSSTGYFFGGGETPLLVASNGSVTLTLPLVPGSSSILIGDGASIYANGTVGFSAAGGVSFAGTPLIGAHDLALALPSINLGEANVLAAAQAAGVLPIGMSLTQDILTQLLAGNPSAGIAATKNLMLSASQSLNFFGSIDLSLVDRASGKPLLSQLVLRTPAIYGLGNAGDTARLAVDTLVWSGMVVPHYDQNRRVIYDSATPGAVLANGPGTGQGSLSFDANRIIFGYPDKSQPNNSVTSNRLMLGFSNVNLQARESITANNKGSLSAYTIGADPGTGFDPKTYAGVGGALNLITPLLTGDAGSIMSYRTGGALTVASPASATAHLAPQALGAEINLNAGTIDVSSAIVLPSGKLTMTASRDIMLADGARLDVSGRAVPFFDVTRYSWGGDVALESTIGNIVQSGGSTIDVSARNSDAGTLQLTALDADAGRIALGGTLLGSGGPGHSGGIIDVRAQLIGTDPGNLTSDFAALNAALNRAGYFGARSFDFKQGNLTIGNEVQAHQVNLSVDGGSLTVAGTIDASSTKPGTIRLAARDNLTLASTAVLDVHGSKLQVDSYGAPIEAKNRGTIELTTSEGWLTLASGATLDLSSPDGGARGKVELNVGRIGETSGDVRISASSPVNLRGASSIAVNGFWSYSPTDVAGTIVQDNGGEAPVGANGAIGLKQIDQRSDQFLNAALANSDLGNRLAGLTVHGEAFHLRPGVEIASYTPNGNLTINGDLDFSGYRYGPNANRDTASANYGAGEPGMFVIRAGGNLIITGSINDGFGYKHAIPTVLDISPPGTVLSSPLSPLKDVTLTTDWLIPNNVFYSTAVLFDTNGNVLWAPEWGFTDNLVPAGTTISWNGLDNGYGNLVFEAGISLPGYTTVVTRGTPAVSATNATAPMLAAGLKSSSFRFVSGADLSSTDSRGVQSLTALARAANAGHTKLENPAEVGGISVLRTGTGNLELLAGGSISQGSAYGIYTAGTQTDPGSTALPSGSYLPDHGGDLRIVAQGDLTGYIYQYQPASNAYNTYAVSNWLWRQGDHASGEKATWSINFGSYATDSYSMQTYLQGFAGFGALGGGNVSLRVGGDAGNLAPARSDNLGGFISTGLVLAVGSSGRVTSVQKSADGRVTGGTLVQTGGGDLTVKIGGRLNPGAAASVATGDDFNGSFTNVRGDIVVDAGAIGAIPLVYNRAELNDPRGIEPYRATLMAIGGARGGPVLVPGDGAVTLRGRGDLVLGGVGDPGQILTGSSQWTWFSLWQPTTSIDLFSVGGNVTPFNPTASGNERWDARSGRPDQMLPAQFRVVAASGSIYYGGFDNSVIELSPSARGQLELLAQDSIYGGAFIPSGSFDGTPEGSLRFNVSGANADLDSIPNPFKPAFNVAYDMYNGFHAYRRDTVTSNLHAGDAQPVRVYAVNGDLLNVALGETAQVYETPTNSYYTRNIGAKLARVLAGRDIVNFGSGAGNTPNPGLILNANGTDVSIVSAGRDMFYTNVQVAGPGTLEVSAGRNLYQGDKGSITSIGSLAAGDTRAGAGIVLQAGVGAFGPDYAKLMQYLDPANLLPADTPLDGSGKVVKTYEKELAEWLKVRYGFEGNGSETLAYFTALAPEQRRVFLRSVYYAELEAGGREYNNPDSRRYGSYLRGRDMIATLFPAKDANGKAIVRQGDITLFGGAGVQTQFGGDIDVLAPGGQVVVGVQGQVPPATSGLLTQGAGDISIYSQGSVLLGLSRIMTTFGGNVLAWSAEGDINAGRGSKTTLVYTPPKREYDAYGNVKLSSNVPSSGAGIATLAPIAEVPAGDVDLIAPLGTIDAGEAGIRVSGNVNLAALQVINAANIQVKGEATGIPTVAAVNVGALINASAAASQATAAAQDVVQRERAAARQNLPSIFTVRVLGFGNETMEGTDSRKAPDPRSGLQSDAPPYDPKNRVQIVGHGQRLKPEMFSHLTEDERRRLQQDR
ncbi:filamentous hemagglutinin family protein [Cupriavidus basilensis]|uniref:Filamentous hemagglutinin family protein n=1 Tax=Cupriavidus basilensis TaxID=68895 RepID=A0ABT6AZH8_9BURK|nr:filamentous haemagglutinin family protein [Cupriavidus basilensis]MDF3837879.1 filamentous hemagglutinin family protein [Cupriavidus basilensis]